MRQVSLPIPKENLVPDTLPGIMLQKEVAERTRLSLGTLRFYRHRGYGGPKSFLLGSRVCYMRADVERWIADSYAAAERVSGESA
jgi:hypothetical protein